MPNLELTEDERRTLAEMLESAVSELGYEIANTDSADYRDGLKAKKATASKVLERLKQSAG
jgi:hypothetical protein